MLYICIPVHNEAPTIGVLLWRLRGAFQDFSREYELVVYDDGTEPGQINTSLTVPPFGAPVPPLIDDPNGRIYRGIDPTVLPFLQGPTQPPVTPPAPPGAPNFQPVLQDRVEVVHFPNPGRYLVICGVLPHFNEGMYGYVEVIP